MICVLQLRIELNIVPTASTTAYKCCLFEDTGSEICNTATVKEESTISVIKEYMICNTSSKSVLAARIAEGSGKTEIMGMRVIIILNIDTQ